MTRVVVHFINKNTQKSRQMVHSMNCYVHLVSLPECGVLKPAESFASICESKLFGIDFNVSV